MSRELWCCTAEPVEPISYSFGLATQAVELPARPANDIEIEAVRFEMGDGPVQLPVKLKVHESLFVPLAKWSMLLTGNYRCIQIDGPRSIRDRRA